MERATKHLTLALDEWLWLHSFIHDIDNCSQSKEQINNIFGEGVFTPQQKEFLVSGEFFRDIQDNFPKNNLRVFDPITLYKSSWEIIKLATIFLLKKKQNCSLDQKRLLNYLLYACG